MPPRKSIAEITKEMTSNAQKFTANKASMLHTEAPKSEKALELEVSRKLAQEKREASILLKQKADFLAQNAKIEEKRQREAAQRQRVADEKAQKAREREEEKRVANEKREAARLEKKMQKEAEAINARRMSEQEAEAAKWQHQADCVKKHKKRMEEYWSYHM